VTGIASPHLIAAAPTLRRRPTTVPPPWDPGFAPPCQLGPLP
jgi:hypothetical protein